MQSRASLLALAASLEATAAELAAKAATIRASLEGSEAQTTGETVTLEAATALLGSKRKAREFFARCEREGFEVRRIGHAVLMARAEWDRAVSTLSSKRAPVSSPATNSTDDESPAAIFRAHGLAANTNVSKGARSRRAA